MSPPQSRPATRRCRPFWRVAACFKDSKYAQFIEIIHGFTYCPVFDPRLISEQKTVWSTHSLAPLSLRGATYSGVFTLLPLLTGQYQAHHGTILREAATLVDSGKLRPLLNERHFSFTDTDVEAAHALVTSGSLGKVVIEM